MTFERMTFELLEALESSHPKMELRHFNSMLSVIDEYIVDDLYPEVVANAKLFVDFADNHDNCETFKRLLSIAELNTIQQIEKVFEVYEAM